ncbi:TrkA family potassium uptake protein [Halovivax sp.]|uniref:potassium channel family protein n=1 Tax=Halovivax sp. TaxID=1935978 RepID=UPI0025BBBEBB|nr:NAD-binding protein [Halovivax sp.]
MSATGTESEDATDWRRRIWVAFAVGAGVVVAYTLLYQWAMAAFEGMQLSFLHSLRIVIESLTTAGFGGDTEHWNSAPVHVLVVLMNLSGVLLVFLAIPLFAVPMFRRAFETRPPTSSTLTDHVIVTGYSAQDEILRSELESVGVDHLYVDPDPELVTELNENGVDAVLGDPEATDAMRAANAESARALVADVDDETNPTVMLAADQVDPDLRAISVIRDYQVEPYHRYAGADDVVLARQLLGKSLAMRAAATYAEKFREVVEVESDVRITELLVERGSDLVGQTFREATVFDRLGITVIGAWLGGKFVVSPDPDTEIDENAILLIAGEREEFPELKARPIPYDEDQSARAVVCGYGTVGWSVTQTLRDQGVEVTVVDLEEKPGVDVVGDITDPETLEEARVDEARAVVLSLDEDTPTIYAALVLEQLAPDVEVIARADDTDSLPKLYNAGADFVLSLPTVTGEILASLLIEEEEIVTPDTEFGFVRTEVPAFADRSLADLDLRAKTGCTIVAIERDGALLTDLRADFVIEEDDVLIVAGSDEAQEEFERTLTVESGRN